MCLYLSKTRSELESYDCKGFGYGCPENHYYGSFIYRCKHDKLYTCFYILRNSILSFQKIRFKDVHIFNASTIENLYTKYASRDKWKSHTQDLHRKGVQ